MIAQLDSVRVHLLASLPDDPSVYLHDRMREDANRDVPEWIGVP